MKTNQSERWNKVRRIWEIIDQLRGEPGCPWDRKQTPESVQTYLVEEAHEAAAAVRSGEKEETADELGDLLFMVLFMVHLYEEEGDFRLEDVCDRITEKMIRRHPHVFGDVTVGSAEEVRGNWEKIKEKERGGNGKKSGGVPESLPALIRAYRIVSRLSQKDPSWDDLQARATECSSKSEHLYKRIASGDAVSAETFGELLFCIANLARIQKLRPEDCLHKWLSAASLERL